VKWFLLKGLLRVLAVDDGYFKPGKKGKALLVGVLSRVDGRIEGIVSTKLEVDGLDSSKQIAKMIKKSKFSSQVNFLILDGVNFAGFNIVDMPFLHKELGIPIISIIRKRPRMEKIEAALSNFEDGKKRLALIASAGKIHKAGNIFFQFAGSDRKTVKTVLVKTTKYGNLPEPLRLAHLIASGVSIGESTRP